MPFSTEPSPQPTQLLFGALPADLFRLLTGKARWFYADLLAYLDREVLGLAGEVVTRQQAIAEIREFFERQGREIEFDEEDLTPGAVSAPSGTDPRPYFIFYRLVGTGWLIEFRDRYRKIVDLNPNARLLLAALLDIQAGRLRSYGGEVLQVLTQLEAAEADAENRSEAIRNAARSSRSFLHHLRSISGALRQIEETLAAQSDLRSLFRTFFVDFVEKFLVEDFKRLKSSTNPFRFRRRIIEVAMEISGNELRMGTLAKAYVREGRGQDVDQAHALISDEIDTIVRVFERLGDYLDLIEDANARIERRLVNTVRFMDRIAETRSEKIAQAMRLVGETNYRLDDELYIPHRIMPVLPIIGGESLYQHRRPKAPVVRRPIRREPSDPALVAYTVALDEYRMRTEITPKKMQAFLDRVLTNTDEIRASDILIEDLDQFFAFERLRALPHLAEGTFSTRFIIEPVPGAKVANEWIECQDFVIRRIKEKVRRA
jgi:hypothetical protein